VSNNYLRTQKIVAMVVIRKMIAKNAITITIILAFGKDSWVSIPSIKVINSGGIVEDLLWVSSVGAVDLNEVLVKLHVGLCNLNFSLHSQRFETDPQKKKLL